MKKKINEENTIYNSSDKLNINFEDGNFLNVIDFIIKN